MWLQPGLWWSVCLLTLVVGGGCHAIVDKPHPRLTGPQVPAPHGDLVPTEKDKSTLPEYTVEAPDILVIEAIRLVPKAPYHILATDVLTVDIEGLPEGPPQNNRYLVDPNGRIDLGPNYGKVYVGGMTDDEAATAIHDKLAEVVKDPQVSVQLYQSTGLQPITGEHLVAPDGRINLGTYGLVEVAGMTLDEARQAVETQLSHFLDQPQVSLSVFAYNSKVYYVITEGAGSGDAVAKFPITGNETVLDAVAQINGLSRLSSKNIWIARPASGESGCDVILPVNWKEITKGAATATNYQVLPGDRVFIAENKMVAFDAAINKAVAPFERMFGITLLGAQSVQTINRFPLGISGTGAGF